VSDGFRKKSRKGEEKRAVSYSIRSTCVWRGEGGSPLSPINHCTYPCLSSANEVMHSTAITRLSRSLQMSLWGKAKWPYVHIH
jgi:hypothetical protein